MLDCHFGNFLYPTYPIVDDVWSLFLSPSTFQQRKENYFLTFLTVTCEHCIWDCEKIDEKRGINLFCDMKLWERTQIHGEAAEEHFKRSTTEKITQHVVCNMDCRILKGKILIDCHCMSKYMWKGIWGLRNIRFWLNLNVMFNEKDD